MGSYISMGKNNKAKKNTESTSKTDTRHGKEHYVKHFSHYFPRISGPEEMYRYLENSSGDFAQLPKEVFHVMVLYLTLQDLVRLFRVSRGIFFWHQMTFFGNNFHTIFHGIVTQRTKKNHVVGNHIFWPNILEMNIFHRWNKKKI